MEARRPVVRAALERLRVAYDLVIAEGAGSCVEVNLRHRDLVNFPVAHQTQAPVVLVADIHKGGVFAQLVGTLEVLEPEDRALVKGLIVNRFRGDIRLFDDGVRWLEACTGLLTRPRDLLPYDLVVLPGTKNTRGDLQWLRETGWEPVLQASHG